MQDLVKIKNNEAFTDTKVLAEKLSGNYQQHKSVIRTLEKLISDSELFPRCTEQHNVTKAKYCNAKFIQTTHTTKRNNKYKMYEMNEDGFMLLVFQLSKFKKASILQQQFIGAFQEMKQVIRKQQQTIEDLIVNGITPIDKKDTKSKINGEKRGKLVRSYYRSTDGKTEDDLNQAIKLTQLTFKF